MKTWISGLLSGICLMFWFIILVGCATPQTHDEWAQRCLAESSVEEIEQCIKKWDAWVTAHALSTTLVYDGRRYQCEEDVKGSRQLEGR